MSMIVLMLNIIQAFIWMWLLLAVHEAGHLLVARFWNKPIVRVEVGNGPLLSEFTLKGIVYKFRLFPFSAGVLILFMSRKKYINLSIIAAGPLVNLLCAPILQLIGCELGAIISFSLFAANVMPFKGFDGAQFIQELHKVRPDPEVI
jgi:membrane-associated protease RseP (regulator of RpoE activity)